MHFSSTIIFFLAFFFFQMQPFSSLFYYKKNPSLSTSLPASGVGHPAAHPGLGSISARRCGLPGAAHAGTHPAQETRRGARGEETQRS